MNIIKFISFQKGVKTNYGNHLCAVHFKDDEKSYLWFPKWKDVRMIYGVAFARECLLYGVNTKEVALFLKQCKEIPNRVEKYKKIRSGEL